MGTTRYHANATHLPCGSYLLGQTAPHSATSSTSLHSPRLEERWIILQSNNLSLVGNKSQSRAETSFVLLLYTLPLYICLAMRGISQKIIPTPTQKAHSCCREAAARPLAVPYRLLFFSSLVAPSRRSYRLGISSWRFCL